MTVPAILVVEDDASLCKLIVRMLEKGGFTAVATGKAAEGLAIVRQRRDALGLAIIDMVMPGMSGLDLATDLQREYPELPILYISGYVDSVAAEVLSKRTPEHVLLKPFDQETLLERVRLLLAPMTQRKPAKSGGDYSSHVRSGTDG